MMESDDRLVILEAARTLGFKYHESGDGSLICTIDQLMQFSAEVANAIATQIMNAFNAVKK